MAERRRSRPGAFILGAALAAALVAAAYWYATGGAPTGGPPPSWLMDGPIAHRGLWASDPARPENSLAAITAAVRAGYAVEVDVRATADGRAVVMHDDALQRMTGDSRRVSATDLVQLRRLRLLGGRERIPTLGEVLKAVAGEVPVLVEIKNRGRAGRLEAAVASELAGYVGQVAVMSFNPYSLAGMARRLPDVPRGQLSGTFKDEDLPLYQVVVLRHLLMNWKSRPVFIAYELDALPYPGAFLWRLRGRPVLAWTAKDAADTTRARRLADGVIADPRGLE